ncbi:MAG: thioesterase family protein [Oscillospiraceae bacterium]|nr:thioesterase family protein [Oscillospiraceae bacterium]
MKPVVIGTKGTAQAVADESRLAVTVGSGSLRVYATPMMCALMEEAACTAIESYLEDDETTVGTYLELQHTSATPEGMAVSAEAEIIGVSGREITYTITANDAAGVIGSCTHKRVLVGSERFMQKVSNKA